MLKKYLQIHYITSCCNHFKLVGHVFLASIYATTQSTKSRNENTYIQIFNWILFSVLALSFASNLTIKCFTFIYQLTSKIGAFNNHDKNVVCWMGLGGLICNAIKYIRLLHRNCCPATIFSSYYPVCILSKAQW